MKNTIRILSGAAMLGLLPFTVSTGFSQTAVEVTAPTTTTTVGTISQFGPDTLAVRTESAAEPVAYRYTKSTTYVDETGAPVSMDIVRSGLPVTVYYTGTGSDLVASKVVVRKTTTPVTPAIEESSTTTTTTTSEHDD